MHNTAEISTILNELLAATVHFWKATSIGFELPQQEL
jgi:hypothetical protein